MFDPATLRGIHASASSHAMSQMKPTALNVPALRSTGLIPLHFPQVNQGFLVKVLLVACVPCNGADNLPQCCMDLLTLYQCGSHLRNTPRYLSNGCYYLWRPV